MVVAGLSVYHDTLESEMQVIPNGQSEYNGDMEFKVSGEIKNTENGKTYKIENSSARQSLLFISDDKIYSIMYINAWSTEGAGGLSQTEFVWLDADTLAPEGSSDKGVKNIKIDNKNFECNVYEYVSPETGQIYTYYVGTHTALIYRIDCEIRNFSYIDGKGSFVNASITADLRYSSVIEGKYESGKTGEIQNIPMKGEETIRMSGEEFERQITDNYSGDISIKTVSNNQSKLNVYLNSYKVYKEVTLTLDGHSDNPYLKIYVPCSDENHLGINRTEQKIGDTIINVYSYTLNYSYIDKNLVSHDGHFTITSVYDEDGKNLESINISGINNVAKYNSSTSYPSEIRYNFESTGVIA